MFAGGAIIEPTLQAVAITPVTPRTLSLRPIAVGIDEPITVRAEPVNAGSGRPGREAETMNKGGQEFFRPERIGGKDS